MGTVAREPVTKSVILITYYEIGISPNKLHQEFRRGHNEPFANLNLYLACEIKLSMPRSHVTAIPLVSSQCAWEQGQHHQGDPLHPQGEREEEHEGRGHAGEEL